MGTTWADPQLDRGWNATTIKQQLDLLDKVFPPALFTGKKSKLRVIVFMPAERTGRKKAQKTRTVTSPV
jgi:hypothetical protein